VLNASDLMVFLQEKAPSGAPDGEPSGAPGDEKNAQIDLLEIPGERRDIANVDYRATVAEAQKTLHENGVEALCVRRTAAPMIESVVGIITQQDIDNYRDHRD
jgi:CIC family chloride channel protein